MSGHSGAGHRRRPTKLLREHLGALCEAFPSFEATTARDGGAQALGLMTLVQPDGTAETVELRLLFSPSYPAALPAVYDEAGRWPIDPDRHILENHAFCLRLHGIEPRPIADAEDVVLFMLDVAFFCQQQLVFDRLGRFPGPEWPHGRRRAAALYILEGLDAVDPSQRHKRWDQIRGSAAWPVARNANCPCGSGTKFKRCCMPASAKRFTAVATREGLKRFDLAALEREAGRAA